MRKFIVALTTALLVLVGVFATIPAKAFAAAPTAIWVEPSDTNNLPMRIDLFKQKSGKTYYQSTSAYQLFLPGDANVNNCFLSWDGGATVTVDGTSYTSGSLPIPALNTNTQFTFRSGGNQTTNSVIVYKGSPNVQRLFIDIDENQGTIADMNADKANWCTGDIYINGQKYALSKMKGRGNASWTSAADDKKPYNITLGSKVTFPGTNSTSKKWSLLAEGLERSMLCNRSGFWLAHQLGIGQETATADVWMNGEYKGCYTVTPKTDTYVTDDGFMIEQDNYQDSEDPQFELEGLITTLQLPPYGHISNYNLITVKKIGDNLLASNGGDPTTVANTVIKDWLQKAWNAIRSDNGWYDNKYYTDYIDIESFAKMYLMFEYVKNYDVCAGSIYFYRDGMADTDKLKAGPIWDLDNSLGSTCNNGNLGGQSDRRSAEGEFVPNIKEYKTSIYKTLWKHDDFKQAVKEQYNRNKAYFDSLDSDVAQMITEMSDSASMNYKKVIDIGNGTYTNLHYYGSPATLGSGNYRQSYVKTTTWDNYTANLRTYIRTRSLWFENKFYDPNFHVHNYVSEVTREATCAEEGVITYTCSCGDTYTEAIPKIDHTFNDETGACEVCGFEAPKATFDCGSGASITVLKTKSIDDVFAENATFANPRDGAGLIDISGEGQVNFVVHVQPGYELVGVTAEGGFKNLKGPDDTGIENGYRLTKVKGDVTVTVTTNAVPRIKRHSMLLSSEIGVQFEVELPDGFDPTDSYMYFSLSDGRTSRVPFADTYQLDEARNSYWFTCYVNVLELADTINATYHYGDGKEVTNTYSGISYISAIKRVYPDNEKLATLVDALQNYGYYMQRSGWTDNKEHKTIERTSALGDDAINAAKDGTSGMRLQKDVGDSGLDVMFSLTLNAATVINVYAAPSGSVDKVTGADNKGTREINGTVYAQYDTDPIPAGDLDKMYKVELTTSSGTATVRGCAMSYVDSVLNSSSFTNEQKLAVTALYNYCAAVEAYED